MIKILFVGDLRNLPNYGAKATTDALIGLFSTNIHDCEIKFIEAESMYGPTPDGGFKDIQKNQYNSISNKVKRLIRSFLPIKIKKCIRILRENDYLDFNKKDFVPYKFGQFEEYYSEIQKGQILQYEKRLLEWADYVYINAEGNIVNGTDKYGRYRIGARYILFLSWLSKEKFHNKTIIANHTVDPQNRNALEMIEKIYPTLDRVFVREPLSINLLNIIGIKNAEMVPDALFTYEDNIKSVPSDIIDFNSPYICVGDSSGFQKKFGGVSWPIDQVLIILINKLKTICPQVIFIDGFNGDNDDINNVIKHTQVKSVNMMSCSYQELYHILKHSQIFISGRWHASILSVLANTPILLWGSDSHKTKSLYPLLSYKYKYFDLASIPANIDELVNEAKKIITESQDIKKHLKTVTSKLSIDAKKNIDFI